MASGVSPDWSPDGRRLVVVRPSPRLVFDDLIGRIYVVSSVGRRLRRVGRVEDAAYPVWSPEGRAIAYDRLDQGVFARRLGSRSARQVATTQISGEIGFVVSSNPAWRPRPPSRRPGR